MRFTVGDTRHHDRLTRLTLVERSRTDDEVRRIWNRNSRQHSTSPQRSDILACSLLRSRRYVAGTNTCLKGRNYYIVNRFTTKFCLSIKSKYLSWLAYWGEVCRLQFPWSNSAVSRALYPQKCGSTATRAYVHKDGSRIWEFISPPYHFNVSLFCYFFNHIFPGKHTPGPQWRFRSKGL